MRRVLVALVFLTALSAGASTYTVNDLGNAGDAVPGDDACDAGSGICTLRAAIEEANAHAGADTIAFSVAGTTTPATALPPVTEQATIDGTTAPTYTTAPVFAVDGAELGAVGLHFDTGSDNSSLTAIAISGFSIAGVRVGSDTVTIQDNYLGAIPAGTPNGDGLQLNGSGSTVEGNVISGNEGHGIAVTGSDHVIVDNFIGTDAAGTAALANNDDGINVSGAATGITIGSATAGEENVISGNFDAGVSIDDGSEIVVDGNYIGVDVTGTSSIANFTGVLVLSAGNTIGTTAAGNVISGNFDGIDIFAPDTIVRNNIVGLDATGTTGLFNGTFGIAAVAVSNVTVGGPGADDGNVVSFNGAEGIFFFEVDTSSIAGNIVGLNAAGTDIRGNGFEGILLLDSSGVTVASNVVSGNSFAGIVDAGGIDNIIENNRVGTSADGATALGNLGTGIEVAASDATIIRSNLVSGNDGHGIETTLGSTDVVMHSNVAGLSLDLSTVLGNTLDGINVCDGASGTIVGSVALGGNIISGNDENGIGVEPTALSNNTWAANSIYDNGLLGIDIGIDGVTPNDTNDIDEGANQYQNFPELDSALTSGAASEVRGTLHTEAGTAFTIHFYSSPAADPSGFGEGQTYLGTTGGTTDVNGDAAFIFIGPALTTGHVVTATATTSDGTSEFSEAENVAAMPAISFSSATYSAGESDGTVTITVTRTGNLDVASTVDYTTSDNTATAGTDYTAASGTLMFVAGDASETFDVTIAPDALDEPDELVNLALSDPGNAVLAAPSTALLTITDDDDAPELSIEDVSLDEGDAGTTAFTFDVTLSAVSAFTVTVDYATAVGTATAGQDYTAIGTTTLTFDPGETVQTVTVDVAGETVFESDEDFFVDLSNAQNASIEDGQGRGTIQNDDELPAISIGNVTREEGNAGTTDFVFDVTLTNASDTAITVDFATADDSATSPADYVAVSGTLTFDPGETLQQVTVTVNGETMFEPDETFNVNLTAPDGATIAAGEGVGTITNDDSQPTVVIGDVAMAEGNGGTTDFAFSVSLSNASSDTVTVTYTTADDTADAGSDYTADAGSVTFDPGETEQFVTILVQGDAIVEPDETFFVNLTGATNATIEDEQGLGTIQNDEGVPTLAIDDVSLAEGDAGTTDFVFTVTLSAQSATEVTVDYATADDTAEEPGDYTAISGQLTFAPGEVTQTVTVEVAGDTTLEGDETFFVDLMNPSGAAFTDAQGLGTIENDDGQPAISIDDVSLAEGDAGTTLFVFNVTLSNPSDTPVTVEYATANGTAAAPGDYTAESGLVTFAPGVTAQTVEIAVNGDVLFEADETFFVDLTNPSGAAVTDAQGLGTIENDDTGPGVSIGDVERNEGPLGFGSNFPFAVTLSEVAGVDVTVEYETNGGTAVEDVDYVGETGVVTIPAGSLQANIVIAGIGDNLPEADETFEVNLTNTNATLADAQGIGTILNDEPELPPPPRADLRINKTTPTTIFTPGQQVTYTITVVNAGPLPALGIVVTDVLPAGATFVSASGPDAVCTGTTTVTCAMATLPLNVPTAITLVITANGNAPISNTASVAAAEPPDQSPLNNASTVVISPAASAGATIPTASEWGLLMLALALAWVAMKRS